MRSRVTGSIRLRSTRSWRSTMFPSLPETPTARPPARVDPGDDLLVDGAGQNHLDDFHRGFVGNAQAVDECGGDVAASSASRRSADLRHAPRPDQCRSASSARCPARNPSARRQSMALPPIFHDNGLVVVLQNVWQRLDQHARSRPPARQPAQLFSRAVSSCTSTSGHSPGNHRLIVRFPGGRNRKAALAA